MLKEIENCQVGRKCRNRMIQLVPFDLQSADKQTMNHNYREAEIKNDAVNGVTCKPRRLMQQRATGEFSTSRDIVEQMSVFSRHCGEREREVEYRIFRFLGICCITAYTANFQSHSVLEGSALSFTVLTIINTNI